MQLMTKARTLARRIVPFAARWRVRMLRRAIADARRNVRFAAARGDVTAYTHVVSAYELPLVCYPGQEARFDAKRHNIERALAVVDGHLIAPGETFSFWRALGRPTERAGYRAAAALKSGVLTDDIGGAICFVSTLLYNAALLGGMAIDERRAHSVDSYGDARYFELGRDASVEYAYLDLRCRNVVDTPLLLRARLNGERATAELRAAAPLAISVRVDVIAPIVTPPETIVRIDRTLAPGSVVVERVGLPGIAVRTRRSVDYAGTHRTDDLGVSVHQAQARIERRGPALAPDSAG